MNTLQSKKTTSRIMIIAWKWQKDIYEADHGKWRVHRSPSETRFDAEDYIYCLIDSLPNLGIERIQRLIAESDAEANIYVFLHRKGGYNGSTINRLLDDLPESSALRTKCFLFGDAHDYLYININPKGLLRIIGDKEGTLDGAQVKADSKENRIQEANGEKNSQENKDSAVFDLEKRLINPVRFDNVWEYYTHYFKTKIFELKEEFLIHFCHFSIKANAVTSVDLFHHLNKNDLLYLMLMTFVEYPESLSKIEREAFDERINKNGTPELINGCLSNLQKVYGTSISKLYIDLQALLVDNIVKPLPPVSDSPEGLNSAELIKTIRNHFRTLLAAMPERTYY
ncbi:MAG: hypothetical protein ACKV1O_18945 [Saprospiraceae bacterium]